MAILQALLNSRNGGTNTISDTSCAITSDLKYGMQNNPEVECLQNFLKSRGPDIYPEGVVSGNFLDLTKKAVIKFQEKYADEILKPLGLDKGTGYVGEATRKKISEISGY